MASLETPLMKQYLEVKSRYADALLFYRMGDFYELFFNDAEVAAKILEIALTARNKNDPNPIAMCGVPHHSATHYIQKLVASGHKVAICEQLEDAASVQKGLVKRDVVRVISPGTQFDLEALDAKSNQYTHAAYLVATSKRVVWATIDYTSGHFIFGLAKSIEEWIQSIKQQHFVEAIFSDDMSQAGLIEQFKNEFTQTYTHTVASFYFAPEYATARLGEQFHTQALSAIHPELNSAMHAAGALVKYFQETQKILSIPSVQKIEWFASADRMQLDAATIRALELFYHDQTQNRDISLFKFLDKTKTAMGARRLKNAMIRPYVVLPAIFERQAAISLLQTDVTKVQAILNPIYDLERLVSRVCLGQAALANARDLSALAQSLVQVQQLLTEIDSNLFFYQDLSAAFSPQLLALAQSTVQKLADQLPISVKEAGLFKKGWNTELDEVIELTENGEQWVVNYEAQQRELTGIQSLKIKYNRVFGYYIEITKSNLKNTPEHYIRKQTTVGGERFITEELKAYEEKILKAERIRQELEFSLFKQLCEEFASHRESILKVAHWVAELDMLAALALVAYENNWVKPEVNHSLHLNLQAAKHPVLGLDDRFVANHLVLEPNKQFMFITGPNMGGKSTLMRQTALITLLAQMGSMVPAQYAEIGLVDRIFTRIGANDNTSDGSSTFMVEMSEMSFILKTATNKSLILIDEIGRGTSTYDGMSLAWAIAKEIAQKIQSRTLFATHYHELTNLAATVDNMVNSRVGVAVSKSGSIQFLYKLEAGAAERSYGIYVARLAGLAEPLLKEAEHLLKKLELRDKQQKTADLNQLNLFTTVDVAPQESQPSEFDRWLENTNLNQLSPLQAYLKLNEFQEQLNQAKPN